MKRKNLILTAVMLLVVALPADAVARNHAKYRNEVLSNSRGFYKEFVLTKRITLCRLLHRCEILHLNAQKWRCWE